MEVVKPGDAPRGLVILLLGLALAGCASGPELDADAAAGRQALDRARLQAEDAAAMTVPGRTVCRERRLGLAEREIERGVTERTPDGAVRVRTGPGRLAPADEYGWRPCR